MTEITQADTHIISMTVAAFKTAQHMARMEERQAIVAWLRGDVLDRFKFIAADIEAGEHLK